MGYHRGRSKRDHDLAARGILSQRNRDRFSIRGGVARFFLRTGPAGSAQLGLAFFFTGSNSSDKVIFKQKQMADRVSSEGFATPRSILLSNVRSTSASPANCS